MKVSAINLNSSIISIDVDVSNWYNYLNNDTIADAILDRIIHSSHRIELEGESMRKLRSKINKI
ncbi:ATP-binding protein [Aliarcobacter butzleri]|uniref:ATP-binding protein n=1 Tax=Aliarcobacter butzleri TaxID=28197 RepID=UPI0021B454DD|nr:ATP-binding protein [Aliarcobacter butzleri]MCT7556422.1 ATP-binding protein [Aliarcobacter butzleri]